MDDSEPTGGPAVDLEGVRPPLQERSRRTLDRIAEAALALLAERGPGGTTVQEIVRRAGSSVGSFYARFDGKEDLLRYLDERVWRQAAERWDRAVAEADPGDGGLEGAVRTVVRLLLDVNERGAPETLETGSPGDGPSEAFLAFRARVREDVSRLLLAHRGRIEHPEPAAAVRFLVRVLEAAIPAVAGPDGIEEGDPSVRRDAAPSAREGRPDPTRELQRMALGYLGRPRRAGDRSDRVDFFDVWG